MAFGALFIYGFDQFNPFAQGHPFEQYEKLKKQYTRIESYTSIRGHLKKMDFFKEQQAYAEYALQCLEHMNQYDFYYKDYGLIDLKIWAMALLVLFNQQYQASFLVQLLQQNYAMFCGLYSYDVHFSSWIFSVALHLYVFFSPQNFKQQ